MRIDILGNCRIGHEPWRLIEFKASGVHSPFDFDRFVLPIPGLPQSYWQVPWDERLLPEITQTDELHACFFLYVDSDEQLQTPTGPIALPPATDRPSRLGFIQFEEP
jgi:hypothetical protein